MLLAYPTLPATSPNDPHVPVPMGLFEVHSAMLWVKGFDTEIIPTPCEVVKFSLMISRWEALLKLGAVFSDPYRTIAARPTRAALVAAMRKFDPQSTYDAYRACVEESVQDGVDPLPEIAEEWQAIVRLAQLD